MNSKRILAPVTALLLAAALLLALPALAGAQSFNTFGIGAGYRWFGDVDGLRAAGVSGTQSTKNLNAGIDLEAYIEHFFNPNIGLGYHYVYSYGKSGGFDTGTSARLRKEAVTQYNLLTLQWVPGGNEGGFGMIAGAGSALHTTRIWQQPNDFNLFFCLLTIGLVCDTGSLDSKRSSTGSSRMFGIFYEDPKTHGSRIGLKYYATDIDPISGSGELVNSDGLALQFNLNFRGS